MAKLASKIVLILLFSKVNSETISCSVSNCKTCESSSICSECKSEYYRSSSGSCNQCPSNCHACRTAGICDKCKSGYYVSDFSEWCVSCPVGCSKCYYIVDSVISSRRCSECTEGYSLSGTNCVKSRSPSPTPSLSAGGYVGVFIGLAVFIIILAVIISVCCKKKPVHSNGINTSIISNEGGYQQPFQPQVMGYNGQNQFMGQQPNQTFDGHAPAPYTPPQPLMFGNQPQFNNQL